MKYFIKLNNLLPGLIVLFLSAPVYTGRAEGLFSVPNEFLIKAAETGDIELARKAITKGTDVNVRIRYQGDESWTALLIAVRAGNIPEVGQENKGYIKRGHVDVARFLLEHGADVNAKTSYGITSLMEAVGNTELLKLLLDYGADVHATDYRGMTALGHAAWGGGWHTAIMLIQHGSELTVTTDSGETLLYLAAGSPGGNPILINYLLNHDFDVNTTTRGGRTALMNAVAHTNRDIVKLLLEHGADPNVESKLDQTTALMIAAGGGDTDTARILLEHGADVHGEAGRRVLSRTINGGRCVPEFIDLLHEYGVEVSVKDRCEESELQWYNYE